MTPVRRSAPAVLSALLLLSGCKAAPQIAGVVTGGTVGAATGSPAIGFLVGIATDAAGNYVVRWYGRSRQGAEQDAIAAIAGPMTVGEAADWKIEHTIPLGDEHGTVRVVRLVDSQLASCKEIVFSVDEGRAEKLKRSWYTADVCQQAQAWKWASAEPAVERWGFLQ